MANKILTEEELDTVTGGTVKEFTSIVSAISANRKLFLKLKDALSNLDENISLNNMKEPVAQVLSGMGIDANLILDSVNENSYKNTKTGKLLSHDEVISRIKNYN